MYEVLSGDTSHTAVSAAIITSVIVNNFPGPEFNLYENCPSEQTVSQSEA